MCKSRHVARVHRRGFVCGCTRQATRSCWLPLASGRCPALAPTRTKRNNPPTRSANPHRTMLPCGLLLVLSAFAAGVTCGRHWDTLASSEVLGTTWGLMQFAWRIACAEAKKRAVRLCEWWCPWQPPAVPPPPPATTAVKLPPRFGRPTGPVAASVAASVARAPPPSPPPPPPVATSPRPDDTKSDSATAGSTTTDSEPAPLCLAAALDAAASAPAAPTPAPTLTAPTAPAAPTPAAPTAPTAPTAPAPVTVENASDAQTPPRPLRRKTRSAALGGAAASVTA